jgi:plastocyanin
MIAITHQENATLQTVGPQVGRTFAMTVVGAGNAALLGALAFFMLIIVAPLAGEPGFPVFFIPIFGAFIAVFFVLTVTTLTWKGARGRAWFWLVAAVPALLLEVLNSRQIPYDFAHPASTNAFLVTIVVIAGAAAVVVGGVAAFLEVRRGRATWTRSGRAGFVTTVVVGVVVGAAGTSLLAGRAASAGEAGPGQAFLSEAPTTTGLVTVETMAFAETNLEMKNGEVLGLLIANKDTFGHSFDVDRLGIHVELPANSTSIVAIKPTGPGDLQFYCSVPGHKSAGMVGTISVD